VAFWWKVVPRMEGRDVVDNRVAAAMAACMQKVVTLLCSAQGTGAPIVVATRCDMWIQILSDGRENPPRLFF
jgi:hypothetical protein